jgi:hypothetical protein
MSAIDHRFHFWQEEREDLSSPPAKFPGAIRIAILIGVTAMLWALIILPFIL